MSGKGMELRSWVWLVAALGLLGGAAPAVAAGPPVQASAAVLINADTGQMLYAKNPHLRLPPASITKIATASLVLSNGHLSDLAQVPVDATLVQGNRVYLNEGQEVDRRTLLYGLMLRSGNDAAVTLADSESGSVPAFVREMNDWARSLGASGTNFANPDGLPDPNHYTTAYDMALIVRRAWQNPLFRQIVGTREYDFPVGGKNTPIFNENRLLTTYPGAVGVKTGYTVEAGETIVAAARRNGVTLIAVVLRTTPSGIWSDPADLLNWGFSHFSPQRLVSRGQQVGFWHLDGRELPLVAAQDVTWLVPRGRRLAVARKLRLGPDPRVIRRGSVVGLLQLESDGRILAAVNLLAGRTVVLPGQPGGLSVWWYAGLGFIMGGWLWGRIRRRRWHWRWRRVRYTIPRRW